MENRCPRLSEAEYEELDARVQLLLRSDGARGLPAIVCEEGRAWIEWNGTRTRVLGLRPLVDEAVDVIERLIHDAGRTTRAETQALEASAVAAGEPVLRAPVSSSDAVRPRPSGGGIAIGLETELPAASLPLMTGPAFHFGGNVGPLLVGGREAFRFGVNDLDVLLMDFEALVGYGAPLDPTKTFGLELRGGAEWMVLYPDGNYARATLAPIASLGLRVSLPWAERARHSAWLGLDARLRLTETALPLEDDVVKASAYSVSFTLGWAYTVWTGK